MPLPRGRAGAVVLAVLVVLSGCGAAGPDSADRPTAVTPAPVPTDAPAGPGVEPVPGLTTEGVASPVRLAEAHRDRLSEATFTRRTTETISGPDGPRRTTTVTVRANLRDFAFRYLRTQRAAPEYPVRSVTPALDLWSNGSYTLSRAEDDGAVRYGVERGLAYGEAVTGITGNEAVVRVLSAFDLRVNETDGGYRLTADGVRRAGDLPIPTLARNLTNATLSAFVTDRGVVRSYRLSYDVTLGGERLRVVETSAVLAVGETRVERPAWAGAAFANASAAAPETGGGDRP